MASGKPRISTTLVLSLLYPAILGAMFYNFLPAVFDWDVIKGRPLLFVSVLLLFTYFFIDYVYTISFPSYSWRAAMLDTLALIFIYKVETVLNPASNATFSGSAATYLLVVHVLFLLWDASERAWHMLWVNVPACVVLVVCILWLDNILFFLTCQVTMCATFGAILRWRMTKEWQPGRAGR